MPATKIESSKNIYQIKVSLIGCRPPIWRRLLLPADMALERLHHVLQAAMGWENCHLHEFRADRRRFGVRDASDGFLDGSATIDERRARISDLLAKAGSKAEYTYDFGDSWEHSILVEKVLPAEPGLTYPVCTGGERNGPPEDCGGLGGFYDLLEALSDPEHPEHEELQEWAGDYDPAVFSVEAVNRKLAPARRRAAKA
jgi:hypothetical protein